MIARLIEWIFGHWISQVEVDDFPGEDAAALVDIGGDFLVPIECLSEITTWNRSQLDTEWN